MLPKVGMPERRVVYAWEGQVEDLQARLKQIATVCDDNAEPTRDAHMALKFIRQIATNRKSR